MNYAFQIAARFLTISLFPPHQDVAYQIQKPRNKWNVASNAESSCLGRLEDGWLCLFCDEKVRHQN